MNISKGWMEGKYEESKKKHKTINLNSKTTMNFSDKSQLNKMKKSKDESPKLKKFYNSTVNLNFKKPFLSKIHIQNSEIPRRIRSCKPRKKTAGDSPGISNSKDIEIQRYLEEKFHAIPFNKFPI